MSIQSEQQSRVECSHCGGERTPSASVAGSYCSTRCFYAAKGAGILDQLRRDHTVCSTCFARVKTIERPSDEAPEAVVGFEYPTKHATHGDAVIRPDDADVETYPDPNPLIKRTLACRCGAVDLSERDDTIERVEGAAVPLNLLRQLIRLYREGAIDHHPGKDRLFDALREAGREYDYAIGYALYGGEE